MIVKTLFVLLTVAGFLAGPMLPATTGAETNPPAAVPPRVTRGDMAPVPPLKTNPPAAAQPGAAPGLVIPATPANPAPPAAEEPATVNLLTARTNPLVRSTNLAARFSNVLSRAGAITAAPAPTTLTATNVARPPVTAQPRPTTPPTLPLTTPRPAGAIPALTPPGGTPAPAGASTIKTPTTTLSAVEAAAGGGADPAEEVFPPGLIKFQDADVIQVLDVYQELTGRTVIRANLPQAKITVRSQTPLTRKEAIQALDTILAAHGITMVPQDEKFVKALPMAEAGAAAREFNELAHGDLPNSASIVAQVVRLTNQMPREVAQALQPFAKLPNSILGIDSAGILVLRDYAENVKRMMEILDKIDVVPQQEFESVVIPIKYALAADIAQVLGSLTAGGGGATTVGRQQTRTGLTGAGGAGGFGQQGGLGGLGQPGGGYPGQPGYNQRGADGGMGLGSSTASRSSFAQRLNQIANRATAQGSGDIVILGTTKIIADERTNSLLIFANKSDLGMISNIIDKLDVVLSQVLIEALIFEVSLNDSLSYGISYRQKKESQSGDFAGIGAILNNLQPPGGPNFLNFDAFQAFGSNGVSSLPGGFSYAAKFGNDLDVAAAAIAGDSRFNVLSRPRIQTSHAVEANLFVGRTRPYPTGSSYGGIYGGYNSIQQLQIGITLSVLPLINPDGLVVMDIRQRTQSVGQDIEIANVGKVPETIDREANAKVAVRDRETIVLGGFISNEKRKSASGVPILKDIPILGHLFRSTSRATDRQELMVLIRPTVLPTPHDAAMIVAEEKRNMPGVATAEREFEKAERKIQKRAEKDLQKDLYRREGFSE